MAARDVTGTAPGGKRTPLAEVLPLATPYVVQVFPIYACNFACCYCLFSIPPERRQFITDRMAMELSCFEKCVDDLVAFSEQVRTLRFVGIGEPLLHRDLAVMVALAVQRRVARTVEILTNGLLLTPAVSDALVAAGLNRLVVSVQGTSRERYAAVCGRDLDFAGFLANLRYFHEHKGSTHVYIKIIDCALQDPGDEAKFRELFGGLCDTLAVERTVPIHRGIDFTRVLPADAGKRTQFGLPVVEQRVCPQPFFTMQINPDGKVVPCYSFEYPGIMGDVRVSSLREIWQGQPFARLRRTMLDGMASVGPVCSACTISRFRQFPEDSLDAHVERLIPMYTVNTNNDR